MKHLGTPIISITIFIIFSCLLIATLYTILNKNEPVIEAAATLPYKDDHVAFNIADYPAKALSPATFSLQAVENKQLLHGADIVIELEMVSMFCGVVKFEATEVEDGIFVGEGIPLMPGIWQATATIQWNKDTSNPQKERISRKFKVVAKS